MSLHLPRFQADSKTLHTPLACITSADVAVWRCVEQETTVNMTSFGPVLESSFAGAGILKRSL